ncbi:MAG: carboxypeptidase regulatory-like domain-containing protein [Ignavibacteriae bacterium]|nr:carboxypeptidase regulatory-like domain-containing protein [Ignavibacteriota bacterium]
MTKFARTLPIFFAAVTLLWLAPAVRGAYPTANRHASFPGSSYISVPNSISLNGALAQSGAMTIDAWIAPSSYAGFPTIVGNTWNTGYWLGLNTTGQLRFYPGSGVLYESNSSVPLNKWTHVAVSFSDVKNEILFYINGTLDRAIGGVTQSLGTSVDDLRIGADRQGASANYFFSGGIDEVRIWSAPISYNVALGLLYRVPHVFAGGLYGNALAAAWRMNGDAVDSARGNDGSAVGSVTYPAGPGVHYERICALFVNDGSSGHDYFSGPSHTGNTFSGSYTIESWAYLAAGGAATAFQTFVCKGSVPNNSFSYWLGVNKQNGRLRFAPTGVWANVLESTDPLPTGQWVHVAATYEYGGNTGTARLYINGVQKGSAGFAGASPSSQASLLVGTSDPQFGPAQAYALAGRLDELRLWNVARSAADIANTFRLEFESGAAGLTGVYHFDGDVLDQSVSANHLYNTNSSANGLYFRDASDLPAAATLVLTVPNGGENWTIGSTQNITWVSAGLGTVTIELSRDGGASFGETVVSNTAAAAGSYPWTVTGPETQNARVRIRSGSSPELIDSSNADFSVLSPPPVILAKPSSLVFTAGQNGPLPPAQDLTISNSGSGVLSWSVSWSSPWLDVTPSGGSGNSGTIQAHIPSTVIAPGTYLDTIRFTGNAANMPYAVPVTLIVTATPRFAAEPAALQFSTQPGVNPPPQYVKIRNAGTGSLAWTASATVQWMQIAPAAGAGGDSILVSINAASLAPGTHTGGVLLNGNGDNSPFVVPVQLIVSNLAYYPVSGRVDAGGVPLANARIDISGDSVLQVLTGADGSFSIPGLRTGSYVVTASSPMYSFIPAAHTIALLVSPRSDLNFSATPRGGSVMLHYRKGWNLVSLPVDPVDGSITTLLPDASPAKAWRYAPDTGYVEESRLVFGVGYWIKFAKTDSVLISGALRGALRLVLKGIGGGWNLVGAGSGPVDIGTLRQTPVDALVNVFQFTPGEGYRFPEGNLLRPGRGYYVKVRRDAVLDLTAPPFAPPDAAVER